MTTSGILQIALYCVLLVAVAKPLGGYMARVYEGEAKLADRVFGPIERLTYRLLRIDSKQEMTWQMYFLQLPVHPKKTLSGSRK